MQFQKGLIPWNKDKKWPREIKRKISESVKILWRNPEYRRHMSEVHRGQVPLIKGKHHTKETKKRISKQLMGRRLPEATKKKIGEVERGERHWNWKGGITPINLKIRNNLESKKWKNSVFVRDNWTCQKCGKRGIELRAHHILNFSEYPQLHFEINNGITLCRNCHRKFHEIYGRKANTKKEIKEFLKN